MRSATCREFSEVPPVILTVIGAVRAVEKLKHLSKHPAKPPQSTGISFSQGSPSGQQSECMARTEDPDTEA
jgi:hypothetical protein